MNEEKLCQNCTYAFDVCQLTCPFCESINPYHFSISQMGIQKITSKMQCPACSFENDLSNQKCVVCETGLYEDKHESYKQCEICGTNIPSHIYAQHSTSCLLSRQLIQKEEEERKQWQRNKTKEKICEHCGLTIPDQIFQDHSTSCLLSKQLIEEQQKSMKIIQEIHKKQNQKPCRYCAVVYPVDLLTQHTKVCPKKPAPIKPSPRIRPIKEQPKIYIPDQPIIPASVYKEGQFLQKSEILRLSQLQYDAMSYMHQKSSRQSNKARVEVQKRSRRLGYNAADLQNLAFYIENYAPVIVHIHITRYMQFFIKDTHYRNQFQTGKSSGSLSRSSRTQWEDRMFDKHYSKAKDFERVKYGVINMTNDPKGVNCASGYGASYMLLKDSVRGRCTITDKDSSSTDARIGTFKYCLHILEKLNDRELGSAFKAAKAMQQSSSVCSTYKQIQIHGPLEFGKDVQRLYVNKKEVEDKKYLDMVYEFSEKFGVDYEFF